MGEDQVRKPNSKPWLVALFLLSGDLGMIYLSFFFATQIRKALIPLMGGLVKWSVYQPFVYICMGFVVFSFSLYKLYPGYGLTAVTEIERGSKALTLVYTFLGVTVYFLKTKPDFPRSIFLIAWLLSLGLVPAFRLLIRNRLSLSSWYGIPVVFILENRHMSFALDSVKSSRRMGWEPLAVHVLDHDYDIGNIPGVPTLSQLEDVISLEKYSLVDTILFATDQLAGNNKKISQIIHQLNVHFNSIILLSSAYELGSIWVEPRDLEGRLGLELRYHLFKPGARFVKRGLDVIGSLILFIVTLPLWLFVAIIIKMDSPGPIFYRHSRIGKGGKKFGMLKFRTMVVDAYSKLSAYLENHPEASEEWEKHQKLREDPRITHVGRWLRKFSVDELPQFWNVLKGEMSLIGPRAVTEQEVEKFGEYAQIILRADPGITGWWQVMGRNEVSWDERTRLEVYYVSNWSLWMDAFIVLKTIWVILTGQGR